MTINAGALHSTKNLFHLLSSYISLSNHPTSTGFMLTCHCTAHILNKATDLTYHSHYVHKASNARTITHKTCNLPDYTFTVEGALFSGQVSGGGGHFVPQATKSGGGDMGMRLELQCDYFLITTVQYPNRICSPI